MDKKMYRVEGRKGDQIVYLNHFEDFEEVVSLFRERSGGEIKYFFSQFEEGEERSRYYFYQIAENENGDDI